MSVAGEDIGDAEILHHDHAGEIDKGNVWLIVVLLPHLPGAAELIGRNVQEEIIARVYFGQKRPDVALCSGNGARPVQALMTSLRM